MRSSPFLSLWELVEGFCSVHSESRAISDHWAHHRDLLGMKVEQTEPLPRTCLADQRKWLCCHLCSPKCLWDPGSAVWGPRFSKVTPSCIQPKYLFQDIMEEYHFGFGFGVIVKDHFRCNSSGTTPSVNFHIWARLALL